jgi:hypothetical protein
VGTLSLNLWKDSGDQPRQNKLEMASVAFGGLFFLRCSLLQDRDPFPRSSLPWLLNPKKVLQSELALKMSSN